MPSVKPLPTSRLLSTVIACLLLVVSALVGCAALVFRIDTPDDLLFIRILDVILGLFVAGAVVLLAKHVVGHRVLFVLFIIVWGGVSGFFLCCHELQVSVRWSGSKRALALNQIRQAQNALREYARDCGGFPSTSKGLAALHEKQDAAGWAGPYLAPKDLIDPWGNPLQYRNHNDKAEVWSNGRDGLANTDDDLRIEDIEHD